MKEKIRLFIRTYKWNRGENLHIYFCGCSNCWFRNPKRLRVCKWCGKKIRFRNYSQTWIWQTLRASFERMFD